MGSRPFHHIQRAPDDFAPPPKKKNGTAEKRIGRDRGGASPSEAEGSSSLREQAGKEPNLTLVYGIGHGNADPQTVGGRGAVGGRQVLAVRELQPLQDGGVGAGEDVLRLAQVVLQDLALVPAQVPRFVRAGAAVARGEGEVAERGDGELGAAVGKVVGPPDHGEGGWEERKAGLFPAIGQSDKPTNQRRGLKISWS